MRKLVDEVVYPDAQLREEDGKRVSQDVLDKLASVPFLFPCSHPLIQSWNSEMEVHAMRMGPGKHLKGRVLMGGIVKPEEFDYFHEVRGSGATSLDARAQC